MKLAKTLAMVACAGLLWAGSVGFARHAYAQDSRSWKTLDASSADQATTPDMKAPPLDVDGCWEGSVTDDVDGTGDIVFEFVQDGTKLENTSTIDFSFADEAFLDGPIKGSVGSDSVTFKGKVAGCSYSGKGKQLVESPDTTNGVIVLELTGKIKFSGKCAKGFKGMTFDITPGCVP
jgi:hypothetical protein